LKRQKIAYPCPEPLLAQQTGRPGRALPDGGDWNIGTIDLDESYEAVVN
jgi:hypothetical protein